MATPSSPISASRARGVAPRAPGRSGDCPRYPEYMSPEQASGERGSARRVTSTVRLCALRDAAGEPPFRGAGPAPPSSNSSPVSRCRCAPCVPSSRARGAWLAQGVAKDPRERFPRRPS
jgi:hypothetical protein